MARRVVEQIRIDAPITRVWRALCAPDDVRAWDGAQPIDVASDYPQPGQHARWRTRIGPLPVVLHDNVRAVEAPRRLAARITYGFVDLDEEYRLEAQGAATLLTSDNVVRSRPRGLAWLAAAMTRRAVRAALAQLARHCNAAM